MSNVATKNNKFAFLNDIKGITFRCIDDTDTAVIEVQGEEVLNIYYETGCLELIALDTCEYFRINRKKTWTFKMKRIWSGKLINCLTKLIPIIHPKSMRKIQL